MIKKLIDNEQCMRSGNSLDSVFKYLTKHKEHFFEYKNSGNSTMSVFDIAGVIQDLYIKNDSIYGNVTYYKNNRNNFDEYDVIGAIIHLRFGEGSKIISINFYVEERGPEYYRALKIAKILGNG